jgi:hypothetical protein
MRIELQGCTRPAWCSRFAVTSLVILPDLLARLSYLYCNIIRERLVWNVTKKGKGSSIGSGGCSG